MSDDYKVNGKEYSLMSPANNRILNKLVDNEVYCNMTQEIGEQVEKHFGYDVIEFEEPDQWTPDSDYLVCCYGSCINFVNWL